MWQHGIEWMAVLSCKWRCCTFHLCLRGPPAYLRDHAPLRGRAIVCASIALCACCHTLRMHSNSPLLDVLLLTYLLDVLLLMCVADVLLLTYLLDG